MTRKKLNFQTYNDLQASHIIGIFSVFKKLSQKKKLILYLKHFNC